MSAPVPQPIAEADALAVQFTQAYYNVFDSDRSQLKNFYTNCSILSFEGMVSQGEEACVKKLQGLPFQVIKHALTTIEGQPTGFGGHIVHVVGQLKTDNDPPHSFTETFYLKPSGPQYYILNQSFRLSLHHN